MIDFLVINYPDERPGFTVTVVFLTSELIFKLISYFPCYRNMRKREKLLSNHIMAAFSFMLIPFLSMIENKKTGYVLTLLLIVVIGGYYVASSLVIISGEISRINSKLFHIFYVGFGFAPLVSSILRIISAAVIEDSFTNALIFAFISVAIIAGSCYFCWRLFVIGSQFKMAEETKKDGEEFKK